MKNQASIAQENFAIKDILLDTIVSAHYLVLQMRMLAVADLCSGNAETELMADALSRWAQQAGGKWRLDETEAERLAQLQQ